MKIVLLLALGFLFNSQVTAQYEDVKQLIRQGVALHDEGKYDEALVKYDEALAIDSRNMDLQYEKSLTLYAAKRFEEARKLCEKMIGDFKGTDGMENVFCSLGNIYDDMGEEKKAIKTYNKGIGYFPGHYLLYFNRGISELRMKENEDALVSLKKSAALKTSHLSSNYFLAELVVNNNKYAALQAYLTYLLFDRKTERAAAIWKTVEKILDAGVKKTGENNITINLSADMFDKKKNAEDDFSSLELMVPMMTASKIDSTMKTLTKDAAEGTSFRLQMVFGLLKNEDHKKGFFWTHYAPIFNDMKEKKHVSAFAHLLNAEINKDADAITWVEKHTDQVTAFQSWVEEYR